MNKTMMLLALSVVSAALFALPAIVSATPAHISAAEKFTVSKGAIETVTLESTVGEKLECHGGISGSGSFENTTTGSLNLTFHGCTVSSPFGGTLTCTSSGAASGTIVTTALPFHLISIAAHTPGILITPGLNPAGSPHFYTMVCGGIATKRVAGNGVIGTITVPTCGTASTTASLSFKEGASTGVQEDTTYTGVKYGLEWGAVPAALTAEGAITFAKSKTITCT